MKYLLPLETIHQITSYSISVFVFYARTKELQDELRVVLLTPGRDNVAFRNRFVMYCFANEAAKREDKHH